MEIDFKGKTALVTGAGKGERNQFFMAIISYE
jgi:hypothetical protein